MVKLKICWGFAVCLAVAQTVCSENESNIARGIQILMDQRCGLPRSIYQRQTFITRPWIARLYSTQKDLPQGEVRSPQPYCTGTLIHKRKLMAITYIHYWGFIPYSSYIILNVGFVLTSAVCLYDKET